MSAAPAPRRRRAVLAGVLGGLALTAGAGVAYAASVDQPAETGYAVVVDEAASGSGAEARQDCPDRGGSQQDGQGGESTAPSPQDGDL